jgi:hypothetical protein
VTGREGTVYSGTAGFRGIVPAARLRRSGTGRKPQLKKEATGDTMLSHCQMTHRSS